MAVLDHRQHHRQDQDEDIGLQRDADIASSASVSTKHIEIILGHHDDGATDKAAAPALTEFRNALAALRARLAAAQEAQLDATIHHLSHRQGQDSRVDLVAVRAAAERAVADERRRICAFELPELLHETPEQLTDAARQDETELRRRLGAALELAMQAPPSLVRFRDELAAELRRAMAEQCGIVSQQATARVALDLDITSDSDGTQQPRSRTRMQRRQRRQLDRVQQSLAHQARDNQRRLRQLHTQLAVIAAVEAARCHWARQAEHAGVLGEGLAAAEVLMERRLTPSGLAASEAPTEPIRALHAASHAVATTHEHQQEA
jgi:hypothetical protein